MTPITWPPLFEHAVGQRAHQAGPATAVDEGQAAPGEGLAHLAGSQKIFPGGLVGRAAVNADGFHNRSKIASGSKNFHKVANLIPQRYWGHANREADGTLR